MGSSEAASRDNKHVGEFIREFLEGERPATVTAGSIRRMIAGFHDDEEVIVAVDSGGAVVIARAGKG